MFESTAIITRRPPCAPVLELYSIGLEGGAVDGAVHRNELRGDDPARLAVDGQREIGRPPGPGPAARSCR
jgi:hypothetical protein